MAKRSASVAARAIAEIPDVYRTDTIHFALPQGLVALRPEKTDAPMLQVVPSAPKDETTASTMLHIYRPVIDNKAKGEAEPFTEHMTPTQVAVGSLMLEAKMAHAMRDGGLPRVKIAPSGMTVLESSSLLNIQDDEGGAIYAVCSAVEVAKQIQSFCVHAPDEKQAQAVMGQLVGSLRPGVEAPGEHVIRYGGAMSYRVPNSWTQKISDGGAVMHLFPMVERDPTVKPDEHTASLALYMPTVWEKKTAREYLNRFIARSFTRDDQQEVSIEHEEAGRIVAKVVWHKDEKPGGHQALCVSTVKGGLAQLACFSAESDAAMKEHGEAGRRFIESVAVAQGSVRDEAPRHPSLESSQPMLSTEI
jgi:hypothetical protein